MDDAIPRSETMSNMQSSSFLIGCLSHDHPAIACVFGSAASSEFG